MRLGARLFDAHLAVAEDVGGRRSEALHDLVQQVLPLGGERGVRGLREVSSVGASRSIRRMISARSSAAWTTP